jgi:hypothetical protein
MQNLQKIQEMIDVQRGKKQKILEIFESMFGTNDLYKLEIDFGKDNVVKVKVKTKSSMKFVIQKNIDKIVEEYNKCYVQDILKIF